MSTAAQDTLPVSAVAPAPAKPSFFSFNNRYLAPLLITIILLVGQLAYGFLESYTRTALAIGTAIGAELLLSRVVAGKWPHLASAYITGISVGILIRSPAYWPFALCSAISIVSKYAIRLRGRHLWNPSNFGVSAMLFLAPFAVASLSVQWGNTLWPMMVVWALGSLIIGRLRRFHICLTYVLSYLAFSVIRAQVTGHTWAADVAPITGPMYQLFIFFMITDPATTVRSKRGQVLVACLVAAVEAVIRLLPVWHGAFGLEQTQAVRLAVHAPYYALFLVGPAANFIEILWIERRKERAAG
jgi:Na+-translocating ferredoxin:NAD+ oxidoreductase RnfD subunit